MAILKKIKASTLVETIVASVIILLIFGISSTLLNTIYKSSLQQDKSVLRYEIQKLKYHYDQGEIKLPYKEEHGTFILKMKNFDKQLEIEVISLDQSSLLLKETYANYES